ncbi:hypothetical protein ES703_113201 [subsurface metagenome]
MKRFLKLFTYGEKGFTLIELLIVIAVLGILAAVLVPNLAGFMVTGKVAAANTEVANVETAALAYYADNDATWPTDTNTDLAGGSPPYISANAGYDYGFDTWGKVDVPEGTAYPDETNICWNVVGHKWVKGTPTP